jgi:hypothetical protein
MAFVDDSVCVAPGTRTQADREDAVAARRRWIDRCSWWIVPKPVDSVEKSRAPPHDDQESRKKLTWRHLLMMASGLHDGRVK